MQAGLELVGRYRLAELLGRGGMGEVWRGLDSRLGRTVAVKVLPLTAGVDDSGVARFRREAEIAAGLTHPGITTVFDIDEHREGQDQLLFLVMELMKGRDLHKVLSEWPNGLPLTQVTDLAAQTLEALSAAHEQGVVHRDIKPANLFLLDGGRLKVCDFGIARLADATKITATGSIAGTPLYMAPEQIEGRPVDVRTDLYSFGCVLYELLTGRPWVDTSAGVGSILYQHIGQAPVPPQALRPEIPDHLDALIRDLLAKQPEQRPDSAAATAECLAGHQASSEPAHHHLPTTRLAPPAQQGTSPLPPTEAALPDSIIGRRPSLWSIWLMSLLAVVVLITSVISLVNGLVQDRSHLCQYGNSSTCNSAGLEVFWGVIGLALGVVFAIAAIWRYSRYPRASDTSQHPPV